MWSYASGRTSAFFGIKFSIGIKAGTLFYLDELQGDIILFKMENFKEGVVVYQPKICHDSKNPSKIVMFKHNVILKNISGSIRDLVKL